MSKATYYVTKEEVCAPCAGTGTVQHPAWEMYWAEFGETGKPKTFEEEDQWFRSKGWDRVPSEETQCVECEGQGKIISEVDFKEALEAFNVLTGAQIVQAITGSLSATAIK
jgi:RecJ-like exonuclease